MLNSEALKDHFEANPGDLAVLTHDRAELHVRRDLVAAQVRHVPSYLVPPSLAAAGAAPKASFKRKKRSDRGGAKRRKGDTSSTRRKDNDPLQTFDAGGLDATPTSGELPRRRRRRRREPPRVFDERSQAIPGTSRRPAASPGRRAHKKGGFKPGGPSASRSSARGTGSVKQGGDRGAGRILRGILGKRSEPAGARGFVRADGVNWRAAAGCRGATQPLVGRCCHWCRPFGA